MGADDVVILGRDAILTTLLTASPMLISGMIIGLIISIFQSVTQIQEFTLTFVPKILAVITVFIFALPWMLNTLLGFVTRLYSNLQPFAR